MKKIKVPAKLHFQTVHVILPKASKYPLGIDIALVPQSVGIQELEDLVDIDPCKGCVGMVDIGVDQPYLMCNGLPDCGMVSDLKGSYCTDLIWVEAEALEIIN